MDRPSAEPRRRSRFRLWCGRLWYTCLRYGLWYFGGLRFARKSGSPSCDYSHFRHRTPLLRRLKDVDMQYQYNKITNLHNKITNLRLAAARLDGVVLRPGETFSYWRLIGRPSRRKGYLDGIVLSAARSARSRRRTLPDVQPDLLDDAPYAADRCRALPPFVRRISRLRPHQPFGSGATCVYPYRDL